MDTIEIAAAKVNEAIIVATKMGLLIVMLPCYPGCEGASCDACKARVKAAHMFDESTQKMASINSGVL